MRTTTAPTEAEIRAMVDQAEPDIGDLIYEFTRRLDYSPTSRREPADGLGLWADLRPSEQERLRVLLSDVFDLEDPIRKMIVDRVVAAGVQFAAEFPDATRARQAVAS